MPGLAGFSVPTSAARQKKCVASPSSHFNLLHSNMRTKETRKADETTKRQPARLSASRFTRLFIYLFPAEQTPELFRRPRHTLFHPLAIEAIPFVVGKKRGTLQERFRFPFASRTFFCLVFFGAPSFFFFPRLNSSCPQLCCRTCCRYLVAEGGPGIIRLVLPSSFSACLPLRHALSPSSESRELLLLFFFSLSESFARRGATGFVREADMVIASSEPRVRTPGLDAAGGSKGSYV